MGDRKMNNKFMPILLGISMIFTLGVSGNHYSDNAIKANAEDTGTFTKIDATKDLSNLVEGDYLIQATYSYSKASYNGILKADYSSTKNEKLAGGLLTLSNNSYINPNVEYIWKLSKVDGYWTIYNSKTNKYASSYVKNGNVTKNNAMLVDRVDDYATWTIQQSTKSGKSTYFDIVNKGSTITQKYLGNGGNNTTGGCFGCYAQSDATCISLFKKEVTIADSISITDGDQSITLTEGETYGSTISYASEGTGDESVTLSSGTDVASLTLDTTNKTISIAANKGTTGTGVYKLVKGTTESAESITVTVNESVTPLITFDYNETGIDETKMELLSNEMYMIPYTAKNCGTSPTITFTSSDESIECYDDEGYLVIETPQNLIDDLAFTITYTIKDGDTEKLTGSLSFTAIAPSITLNPTDLVVDEYGTLDVGVTLTGFDTSKVSVTLDTGESTNYTASISEDKSTITLMGLTECEDDMLSVDVTDGTRNLNDTYTVIVNGATKYDNDIYTKITSVDDIVDGKYVLVYEETVNDVTTYYAFNGKDESKGYNTNTKVASNGSFDTVKLNITKNSDGTYYLQVNGGDNNGKYIDMTNSEKNGLEFNDITETYSPKQTITFDETYGLLIKGTSGGAIRFNTTSGQNRFRYFKTATYTDSEKVGIYKPVSLYKVDEANTTLGYANIFQSVLSEPCNDVDVNNKDSVSAVWTYLANRYNGMPSVVQQQLTSGDSTDETVITALARYDHIIGRYQLNDFMKRSNSSSRNQMIFNNDTDTAVTIIVVVTLLSVTSIGGYFFIRRRKHA